MSAGRRPRDPSRGEAGQALPRIDSPAGRWVVAASVLGSGAVFLEGTVVNVALPALARDQGLAMDGVQWVLNGYLLTLSALMLVGGALGDRYARARVFSLGAVGFAITSLAAALAPSVPLLLAARVLQGAAGALLVPNSLALLDESFAADERGTAIGRWAAWSSVSTAAGPFLGGWVVDAFSWRWVLAGVAPLPLAAAWLALRHAPRTHRGGKAAGVDHAGGVLVTGALAALAYLLIEGPRVGFAVPRMVAALLASLLLGAGFVWREQHAAHPLLPLKLFRSRQFSAANLTTLLVYLALSGVFFLLVLVLQNALGYSALQAGLALLPLNLVMLLVSPRAGRWAGKVGPRAPMSLGCAVAAGGLLLLSRLQPGLAYPRGVLPGLLVFALGLALLVAPLTAAVLGAVEDRLAGVASATNNAVARLAGMLGVAALPAAVGLGGHQALSGPPLVAGYQRAMLAGAGLCALGGVVALLLIRRGAPVEAVASPAHAFGCTQRSASGARLAESA